MRLPLTTKFLFCLIAATAAFPLAAAGSADNFSVQMSGAKEPPARALGTWNYSLKSGDATFGSQTISVASAPYFANTIYKVAQAGEFEMSATQTQRISTSARLNPDLSLIDYEKTMQRIESGKIAATEKTTISVGAMAVTITHTRENGKTETKTLKSNGPVYYAFGSALIFMRIGELKNEASYTFPCVLTGDDRIGDCILGVTGTVKTREKSGVFEFKRISATFGEGGMTFNLDTSGNIIEYGPSTGEMTFYLNKK